MEVEKTWWWVRHAPVTCAGEHIYGQLDLPCDCDDDAGFDHAISQLPEIALWVTTPLIRTAQTEAALLAAADRLGLRRNVSARMVEQRFVEQHLGHWQNRTRDEIDLLRRQPRPDHWLGLPHECPLGGESFVDLQARVGAGIDELQRATGPQHIVVVAHAGTIRAALVHTLGMAVETALGVTVSNCAVVRMTLRHDGPRRIGKLQF
jgi:alpha-ribazole phosphatase